MYSSDVINQFKQINYILIMANIIGVNPRADQFFPKIISNLKSIFNTERPVERIEIEIKYAEFTFFCGNFDESAFKELNNQSKQKVYNLYRYQQDLFFKSLGLLSKQSIVHLNPLGSNVYNLLSCFNESIHKRFYHIRDFLIKVCKHNERNQFEMKPLPANFETQPIDIYHEFSLNANNHLLRLIEDNEIRLDMEVTQHASYGLTGGRYSYSTKSGWKLTKKNYFCPQVDFLFAQKSFRFAINHEEDCDVPPRALKLLAQYIQTNRNVVKIRIKRMMRAVKGDMCEYSLSQVYSINERSEAIIFPNLFKKLATSDRQKMNIYISRIFVNFYSIHEKDNINFEIESQFSKPMLTKIKSLLAQDNVEEVQKMIGHLIEELYALYHCEHATKGKEIAWLGKKISEAPLGRLETEHGTYMRHILYQFMTQRKR